VSFPYARRCGRGKQAYLEISAAGGIIARAALFTLVK